MNKKDSKGKGFLIIFAIILIAMVINSLKKNNFTNMVDNLRQQTAPMYDSMNIVRKRQNDFEKNIQLLIQNKNFPIATTLLDSAIRVSPADGLLRVYQGMLYAAESKYPQAFQSYDSAVFLEGQEFPLIQDKKGDLFLKLHDYANALNNYKKAAAVNYDYYSKVAQTFEAMKKNDSALKYYLIYKGNDTTNTFVNDKVYLLSKNGNLSK